MNCIRFKTTLVKVTLITALLMGLSCSKNDLEVKPDQHLMVPTTLEDLQALLNNGNIMNLGPGVHIISDDDFEVFTPAAHASFGSTAERNAYLWKQDLYESSTYMPDWDHAYKLIFYTNVVLKGLDKIERVQKNSVQYDNIKGSALFFRGMAFYQLATQFADAYETGTAATKLGIPLKLTVDLDEKLTRGTLQQTFDRITDDVGQAALLLANNEEALPLKPSKLAANALLARIFLYMGNYGKALKYADACLAIRSSLIDYNSLSKTSTRPISTQLAMSTEVIFWQLMHDYLFPLRTTTSISTEVINSYNSNDLRKDIFLRNRNNGIYTFKGNYSGDSFIFTGMAIDEVYLIRAECKARSGDIDGAMDDLHLLMTHRWDNRVLLPRFTAANETEALVKVLAERRKELITRGTRWSDLKRLNLDGRFAVTLRRRLDNVDYQLPPKDKRYAFPIPMVEIEAHNLQQNDR